MKNRCDLALGHLYPECTRREIKDLREAMRHDKFWKALPMGVAIYVAALTRAERPAVHGLHAKVTFLGKLVVNPDVAQWCRRGMILLAVQTGQGNRGISAIRWPAFRRLMKVECKVMARLINSGKFPPVVGLQEAKRLAEREEERQ